MSACKELRKGGKCKGNKTKLRAGNEMVHILRVTKEISTCIKIHGYAFQQVQSYCVIVSK